MSAEARLRRLDMRVGFPRPESGYIVRAENGRK
jgi:hypothetical protein